MTANHPRRALWPGNAEKERILRLLADDPRAAEGVVIIDYGCGRGALWRPFLAAVPATTLVGYEPDPASAEAAAVTLEPLGATVVASTDIIDEHCGTADHVTSLSVLEHVWDKRTYLANAAALLKPGGTLHLNYDDGHFRSSLDLDRFREWLPDIKSAVLTRLAWFDQRRRRYDRYQARVDPVEVDRIVADLGLTVLDIRYGNLTDFKELAKRLPADQTDAFHDLWLSVEQSLNEQVAAIGPAHLGDPHVLWSVMRSRTLTLRRDAA